MNSETATTPIHLPESLDRQLQQYRRDVRSAKMLEAIGMAVVGILIGFLAIFLVDRVVDGMPWFRWLVFLIAVAGLATIPLWFERWVLRLRTQTSLARLMSHKLPSFGDSLLGAIELAANPDEQSRSPGLCQAALQQVANDAEKRDLRTAAPDAYHRRWWLLSSIAAVATLLIAFLYPAAAINALQRFAMPWSNIPRFTFAAVQPIPDPWIVPHGEPIHLTFPLSEQSAWRPETASLTLPNLPAMKADLGPTGYRFDLPPQIQPSRIRLKVGDASPMVNIQPELRPQLAGLTARAQLPEYLERAEPVLRDVRGGTLTLVRGSRLSLDGQVNRKLAEATLDGQEIHATGDRFEHAGLQPAENTNYLLQWRDVHGLAAKLPFQLQLQIRDDEQPTIFADGLPRSKVVLDSEQLRFQVRASDDFGVRKVGMEWRTAEGASSSDPVHGEWSLAAGSPTAESLDAESIFQATALNVPAQPIELRIFVEDYFPNRGRVYSSPHLLYILNASDHAVWVLQQLNRWQREALEVRDRELQLLEGNKKLRALSPEELSKDGIRSQIEQQAAAEQANARRLGGLNQRGEDLLRQAARNPEIGVGHLEKWAEMQKVLRDIAAHRMPSVANLLKQAGKPSKAQDGAGSQPSPKVAGMNRNENEQNANSKQDPTAPDAPKTSAPRVIDQESSQQPPGDATPEENNNKKSKPGALRLPTTTLAGSGKTKGQPEEPPSAAANVDQAVEEQIALLEEFDKVSEELNKIMANLEGSTLVKRFKAAAREQIAVADTTTKTLPTAFGQRLKRLAPADRTLLEQLATRETTAMNSVGQIIDDLEAFHERRPMLKFRDVLDEVRREDPLGGLRQLSQQVIDQQGMAIAEAEYWSDTFDRWAEDLVDPACQGKCPGSKSKSSLPPSIVLEVMQILEEEMNLRDRTRVVEQSRAAETPEHHLDAADALAKAQSILRDRVIAVGEKIQELPNAAEEFAQEIGLMQKVDEVMQDATRILSIPETGRRAIAAETEVIELLLKSKRINPKSGGGGGSSPGGGGGGETSDAAISLVGPGTNEKELRQDHGIEQANGVIESELPEEFRHGLDQYFDQVERSKPQ